MSLPVRGAWIEMKVNRRYVKSASTSLPVRGAWIEIALEIASPTRTIGRSPCGERGLKSLDIGEVGGENVSLPVRGAWIEIFVTMLIMAFGVASLPVRGAWIEIVSVSMCSQPPLLSLPVRGAWIEMFRSKSGRT